EKSCLGRVLGDLAEKPRRPPLLDAPVDETTVGDRYGQGVFGPRHSDVEESPLLFELVLVLGGLAVRKEALLEPDDEDVLELEALGGVQRRERDGTGGTRGARGARARRG